MNSKIWKSLCECLKRNTTIQPSHHDEDSDVLALAIIELFSDRHAEKPVHDRAMWMATADANGVSPDVAASEFELISGKEFRTLTHSKGLARAPEGDGWTLHSSTSFDATWVRDCPGLDTWRDVTAADVGKRFLVKFGNGYVTLGIVTENLTAVVARKVYGDETFFNSTSYTFKIRNIPS
jgi:hypothetical protein